MTYQEQIRSPKWQRKRLEIMDRDQWTCRHCGDSAATLTVHHKSYVMGSDGSFIEVWDYDQGDLITLCEDCHSQEESTLSSLKKTLFHEVRSLTEDARAISAIVTVLSSIHHVLQNRLTEKDILSCINYYSIPRGEL